MRVEPSSREEPYDFYALNEINKLFSEPARTHKICILTNNIFKRIHASEDRIGLQEALENFQEQFYVNENKEITNFKKMEEKPGKTYWSVRKLEHMFESPEIMKKILGEMNQKYKELNLNPRMADALEFYEERFAQVDIKGKEES